MKFASTSNPTKTINNHNNVNVNALSNIDKVESKIQKKKMNIKSLSSEIVSNSDSKKKSHSLSNGNKDMDEILTHLLSSTRLIDLINQVIKNDPGILKSNNYIHEKLNMINEKYDEKMNLLLSRIENIEGTLNDLKLQTQESCNQVETINQTLETKIYDIEKTIRRNQDDFSTKLHEDLLKELEREKKKRILMIKKTNDENSERLHQIQQKIEMTNDATTTVFQALKDVVDVHAEDIKRMNNDLAFMKKWNDNVMNLNTNNTSNEERLNNLANKHGSYEQLIELERKIFRLETNYKQLLKFSSSTTPSHIPVPIVVKSGGGSVATRLSQIEEIIADMQKHSIDQTTLLHELKRQYLELPIHHHPHNKDIENIEIETVKKRLRELTESTRLMCRSLTSGFNDLQHATISLYSWGDKVHKAIGKLSTNTGISHNPCPMIPNVPTEFLQS